MKRKTLSLRMERLRTLSAAELRVVRGRATTAENTANTSLEDGTSDEVTRDCIIETTTDGTLVNDHRWE